MTYHKLLTLVVKEYNYAVGLCNWFTEKGVVDSAEAWSLVATRLRRVLDDNEKVEEE
jgi:hypothetical protein